MAGAEMKPKADLTADELRRVLNYNADSGVFRWLIKLGQRTRVGAVAGYQMNKGYWSIQIMGRSYLAHRLAWLHVYGEWPEGELDHADNNRLNNSIANLRLATHRENCRNQRKRINNKSGHKGVSWHKPRRKWMAQIVVDGKKISIGYFECAREAAEAYARTARALHGEFWRA